VVRGAVRCLIFSFYGVFGFYPTLAPQVYSFLNKQTLKIDANVTRRCFFLVFKAQSEALRSYTGKAHVHRPSIVLYHTLPEMAPHGDEDETSGHRNRLDLSHIRESISRRIRNC
jgi:hypothetical protein